VIVDTAVGMAAILRGRPRVAMLGASANHQRASYFVFTYLRTRGWDIVPVNPNYDEVNGVPCAKTLADVDPVPGIVDVFLRPADLPEIVEEVIVSGAPVLWLQYGVIHDEAIRRADAAGLKVVVDHCMKIEWARLNGGLAMAGMNTGRIRSRRYDAA